MVGSYAVSTWTLVSPESLVEAGIYSPDTVRELVYHSSAKTEDYVSEDEEEADSTLVP